MYYKIINIKKNFLFILLFIVSTSVVGQTAIFLPIKKLETTDGLSSPNVRKILQDKYGFMWFATQDGLNRFDGNNFITFTGNNQDNRKSLLTSDVFDIHFDKNGDFMWVLTAYGGLNKIDISTSAVVAKYRLQNNTDSTFTSWFKCLVINDDDVLVGSNENVLIRFNSKTTKITYFNEITHNTNREVHLDRVLVDSLKRVWLFFSNYGIVIKNKDFTKTIAYISAEKLTKGSPHIEFTDKAIIENRVLITTSDGLKIISTLDFSFIEGGLGLSSNKTIQFLKESLTAISIKNETVLLAGKNGLFRINLETNRVNQIIASKNLEDKEWLSFSNSIFQSGTSIWIGSLYGIAWIKDVSTFFTAYYTSMGKNSDKIEHSMTLLPTNDSILYVCSDIGIFKANSLTSEIKKVGKEGMYFSIGKLEDNLFIASGPNGSLLLSEKGTTMSLSSKFAELKPLESDALIDIRNINDSIYFFSSQLQRGLHIWNKKNRSFWTINTNSSNIKLKSNIINRVFIDSKKTIWIICDAVISTLNLFENKITHLNIINPENKQPLSINMDMCELNNEYWIAVYGTGIVRLSDTKKIIRIYDSKDGINNLGLYKILSLNDSTIIASSNNGLSALNIKSGKVINYFESDGLQSNNFEETSGIAYKNDIFFGGRNGFTKIDKNKFIINNTSPVLFFNSVQIQTSEKNIDTSYLFIKTLLVPNNTSLVTVNFSSIYYSAPEKIKFEYRIYQKSDLWVSIGSSHSIAIIPLPPGTYRLQLRAANEAGVWSNPIELTLIFLPKWYQTWWFKTIIALSIIAIGYSLYRMRINQLKKEEKIRNQLASDLHDDLGSTLNSVKVYSNLAIMEKNNPNHLLKIKEGTQEAIAGVRDLIWVLDDKKDTIQDLFSRINQFAAHLCEANHIAFIQNIDDSLYHHELGKEEKRNIYMIVKESINNSIKYADCKKIELKIITEGKKLRFIIQDDGKGFDKEKFKEGNGLKNITNRAKKISYKSFITSSIGNGTIIMVEKI